MFKEASIENLIGTGNFRDSGCQYSKSCLNCVLEFCHYDVSAGKQKRNRLYKEIIELDKSGMSIKYIAQHFQKTIKDIHRIRQSRVYKRMAQ